MMNSFHFFEGSGDAGEKRGGMRLIQKLIVIEADNVTISFSIERKKQAPWCFL